MIDYTFLRPVLVFQLIASLSVAVCDEVSQLTRAELDNSIQISSDAYQAMTGLPAIRSNILESAFKGHSTDPNVAIEVGNAVYVGVVTGAITDSTSLAEVAATWFDNAFVLYNLGKGVLQGGGIGLESMQKDIAMSSLAKVVANPSGRVYSFLSAELLLKEKDERGLLILNSVTRWNSIENPGVKGRILKLIREADAQSWGEVKIDAGELLKGVE